MEYIIKRTKRKTIALEINSNGQIIVRSPLKIDDLFIDKLVQRKKQWISKKMKLIQKRISKKVIKKFEPGEYFMFLGKKYILTINQKQKENIILNTKILAKQKDPLKIKDNIFKWYKKEALIYFKKRINILALNHGFKYNNVAISNAKKRLGVCNQHNDIRINWRLILCPADIIDYVLIHELVHTKIKNHSKNYWNKVSSILPDYKKSEKWLKDNREELFFNT